MRLLGYVWSAPYAVLGLLGGLAFWALGWARPRWQVGALIVDASGSPAGRWFNGRHWGAFTLGWTIFTWEAPSFPLLVHERRHVWQALVLGPLFPVVYLAILPFTRYRNHPLERDARRAAGDPN